MPPGVTALTPHPSELLEPVVSSALQALTSLLRDRRSLACCTRKPKPRTECTRAHAQCALQRSRSGCLFPPKLGGARRASCLFSVCRRALSLSVYPGEPVGREMNRNARKRSLRSAPFTFLRYAHPVFFQFVERRRQRVQLSNGLHATLEVRTHCSNIVALSFYARLGGCYEIVDLSRQKVCFVQLCRL